MTTKKIYIFTLPKAGTYFLADLISRFGFINSGRHIAVNHYVDNRHADLERAARRPCDFIVRQSYIDSLTEVPESGLCYGHTSPMIFPPYISRQFVVVACRRNPRDILISEFIDFRFRREDVEWITQDAIADHKLAFIEYLRINGPVIASIIADYVAYRALRSASYYISTRSLGAYLDITYESIFSAPLESMRAISNCLGCDFDDDKLISIFESAASAENKTKTIGQQFPVARGDLWTDEAERQYRKLNFPLLTSLLGYPEL